MNLPEELNTPYMRRVWAQMSQKEKGEFVHDLWKQSWPVLTKQAEFCKCGYHISKHSHYKNCPRFTPLGNQQGYYPVSQFKSIIPGAKMSGNAIDFDLDAVGMNELINAVPSGKEDIIVIVNLETMKLNPEPAARMFVA